MKEIQFSSDGDVSIFNFYFSQNAQILLTMIGGLLIFVFCLLYLIKPFFNLNDEGFLLIALFIASAVSMHMYRKYQWLSLRNRLEISSEAVLHYHAETLIKSLKVDDVSKVVKGRMYVLIFPLNSIEIIGNDEKILIVGFKKGEDIDEVAKKISDIIARKTSG